MNKNEFDSKYLNIAPTKEMVERQDRAFNALLAYEKNCIAKYDYPDWTCKPSKTPIKGERMGDFAMRYGTTIKEMKDQWRQVEYALGQNQTK